MNVCAQAIHQQCACACACACAVRADSGSSTTSPTPLSPALAMAADLSHPQHRVGNNNGGAPSQWARENADSVRC